MKSTTIFDLQKPMQTRAAMNKATPLLFRSRAVFTQSLVVRRAAVGMAIALPAFAEASVGNETAQEAAKAPKSTLGQYALPDSFLHVTAWTFVAPQEWTRTGGVYWTGRLLPLAYYSELKITNPKGSEQLQLFPTAIYVATRDPMWAAGRLTCPYLQADECIRRILLPQYRPHARDVKVIAIDKQPRQLLAEGEARARAQGAVQCDVRAARVLVEYQEGERTMREMFFCTLMALPSTGGPTVWCVERALGLRADKESFEQSYRMLGLITSSLRENQSWVAARGRQLRAMVPPPTPRNSTSGSPSILDVSRSISRNNDEFLKNIDAVNTARLNTPASDGWTRAYRNTERVVNPSTGEEMDVTGGYLQYYQDYSGRIYASNDPADFYLQTRIGGTVLQPAQ